MDAKNRKTAKPVSDVGLPTYLPTYMPSYLPTYKSDNNRQANFPPSNIKCKWIYMLMLKRKYKKCCWLLSVWELEFMSA